MDMPACRDQILEDLHRLFPGRELEAPRIFTDTTDFYSINSGDVIFLDETHRFLVGNNAREGRFGLDDEVKYWVKRARNLATCERNILKLVFYERFNTRIGDMEVECFRSPGKESRILELVRGNPGFMQGTTLLDEAGNRVRVLEVVSGRSLQDEILAFDCGHEEYFHQAFPAVFRRFMESVEAIALLHSLEEKHGDVRRDHILVESCTGRFRWIDFDYNFLHLENIFSLDIIGLGNILIFLAGKGDTIVSDVKRDHPGVFDTLYWEDTSLVWQNRVANLKKLYPYIPESLNRILVQFSNQATLSYQHAGDMLEDLAAIQDDLPLPEE
ncbi:hypothetical protein [Fundidesulfovibrio terrae]|uniref:hypothetical protein n=1 Tax=Fundidesulfovibrio terrae TaxID=2922866 RepID=UPI001FAF6533|nr:hypothetical protein [Fundidesulfovibrio terrae]